MPKGDGALTTEPSYFPTSRRCRRTSTRRDLFQHEVEQCGPAVASENCHRHRRRRIESDALWEFLKLNEEDAPVKDKRNDDTNDHSCRDPCLHWSGCPPPAYGATADC